MKLDFEDDKFVTYLMIAMMGVRIFGYAGDVKTMFA